MKMRSINNVHKKKKEKKEREKKLVKNVRSISFMYLLQQEYHKSISEYVLRDITFRTRIINKIARNSITFLHPSCIQKSISE